MSDKIPFLRPGVLHFLGSFFNLDEERLLANPKKFGLSVEKVEKGALSFHQTIAPGDSENSGTGWEILYTALGLPLADLKTRDNEAPQKYVSRIWGKMMLAQGLLMYLDIKKLRNKERSWVFSVHQTQTELVKNAMRLAKSRYENSPTFSSKAAEVNKETNVIFQNEGRLRRSVGMDLVKAIENKKRVLFLTPDASTARQVIPFMFQYGVHHGILGTSRLISADKRLNTSPSHLHEAQVLLISANHVPLRYVPEDFDLVILWGFQDILNALHVAQPLPNFIAMSRVGKREYPPSYYKDLWKAADLFHFFRQMIQNAENVWVTGIIPGLSVAFLEKMRGPVTVAVQAPLPPETPDTR